MTAWEENRHSILIEAKPEEALPEIVRWGEAAWWPKGSLMRFVRLGSGPVSVGTLYRQKVLLPFAPSWNAEVTALNGRGITRKFSNGMFEGQETVSFKEGPGGLEVGYFMHYRVSGRLNRVVWSLFFRRLHDNNIVAILRNLKIFLEKKR